MMVGSLKVNNDNRFHDIYIHTHTLILTYVNNVTRHSRYNNQRW